MKVVKSHPLIQGRLQSIDALRGIAALGVVLYHAVVQGSNGLPNNLFRWPVKLLQFVSSFGYIGVFLFFVISGFCIHLQWAKSRANNRPSSVRFGTFWRRRLRRLYPPYLIALALFIIMAALTTGINVTHFFVYDVVMHLLMLHNLDPYTCYSINGVFWTLAIEEQLYLAYFLLLFLRTRWGWGPTLLICAAARVGWFMFSHAVWVTKGVGVPVPEAAASHWFTGHWGNCSGGRFRLGQTAKVVPQPLARRRRNRGCISNLNDPADYAERHAPSQPGLDVDASSVGVRFFHSGKSSGAGGAGSADELR